MLVSAVQKLSRVQNNIKTGAKLYRGLGGLSDFPSDFYKEDENGCKGFLEWGFMSTTSELNIALKYSGVEQSRPKPTVLIVEASSVDRGACVQSLSQYKHEIEYLWMPCSFVEQVGPKFLTVTKTGAITMIPVKINSNLKTQTVEELIAQKKSMHIQSFDFLQLEVKTKLFNYLSLDQTVEKAKISDMFSIKDLVNVKNSYVSDLIMMLDKAESTNTEIVAEKMTDAAMTDCTEIFRRQKSMSIEDFLDSAKYRTLVSDMMIAVELPLLKLQYNTGFPFYFTSEDVSCAVQERNLLLGSVSENFRDNNIESIFIKYSDPHLGTRPKLISSCNIRKALNSLALRDLTDTEERTNLKFCASGCDENDGYGQSYLTLEAFSSFVRTCESSSWSMKWAASLPLTELLGRALSSIATVSEAKSTEIDQNTKNPVRFFALMEPAHANILANGMFEHLKEILLNSSMLLRRALTNQSKLEHGLAIEFESFGTLPDFHYALADFHQEMQGKSNSKICLSSLYTI